MTVWVCEECTTAYGVDAPKCPHCGSHAYRENGDGVPKISKAQGASYPEDGPVESQEEAPQPLEDEEPTEAADSKKAAKKAASKQESE